MNVNLKVCSHYTHTHTLIHTPPHTHKSAHENWGMSGDASGKEPACQRKLDVRDTGSVPGWERSPGEGIDNPLQYSRLENPMDRGTWWASLWGRKELDLTEQLSKQAKALQVLLPIKKISLQTCFLKCE